MPALMDSMELTDKAVCLDCQDFRDQRARPVSPVFLASLVAMAFLASPVCRASVAMMACRDFLASLVLM